ncbi:hypothetical protein MCOR25_007823 [Pyricularia grisea]|nr:hypothetical protein MCOR25_007823 [Pyricularia grisea]
MVSLGLVVIAAIRTAVMDMVMTTNTAIVMEKTTGRIVGTDMAKIVEKDMITDATAIMMMKVTGMIMTERNGHYGSNKDGYNYDRHKDTGKSSYGHIGNKHNHHDYDRRKDYTGSNGAHGPRATSAIKLGFNKTLDNPPTSVNTAGENGTAMTIANTTTQLSTTTVHGGHDNDDKERCRWSFTVVTQQRGRQRCSFEAGRRASVAEVDCGGHFVVSGGWSGQFGDGQGFTTLSVIDRERRLIVWPAYRDSQLEGGKVVRPDQSYVPQRLP